MFLDFLNNPIDVDDLVIYPQGAGSSSAYIQMARVVTIDPVVKVPTQWGECLYYASSRPKPGEYKAEAKPPLRYVRTGPGNSGWSSEADPDRAYRLRVQRLKWDYDLEVWENDGKPVWIRNVDRVTVVTDLVRS